MISVQDAFDRILGPLEVLGPRHVPLSQASGHILAGDITARRTQPAANLSAMDGYAVHSSDLRPGAQSVQLKIVGEAAAGSPARYTVLSGTATRIFTGGVVPSGTDQIVIQENTERDGDVLKLSEPPHAGANIRRAGSDFQEGDTVLRQGALITVRTLGLLAASGHASVPVFRAPSVSIFATGDELVGADHQDFLPFQTVDSATPMIHAGLERAGADVIETAILKDDLPSMTRRITEASEKSDLLITIGGASVGARDFVGSALEAAGFELDFWKIAMRPGKPMMVARKSGCTAIGLPGNAVSAFVCARLFLEPAVRKLAGHTATFPVSETLPSLTDVSANGPRTHFMRAKLERSTTGDLSVRSLPSQDSSLVSLLAEADCLIVRQPGAPLLAAGSSVEVIQL